MENWPNLFIVGPPKTGTTSLYNYLDSVTGIFMSKNKEPHYFAQSKLSKRKFFKQINDKRKYLELFESVKDEKIIGEASTSYFADDLAPELIKRVSPDAHIIISLRDPVERIYSNYLFDFNNGLFKLSFSDELELGFKYWPNQDRYILRLQSGVHSECVKRYLKIFGSKQVKILIFEEWIKNIKNTMNEIMEFLRMDYVFTDIIQDTYNPYAIPRGSISQMILGNTNIHKVSTSLFPNSTRDFLKRFLVKKGKKPKIREEDREKLVKFFQDDVRELEKLLGRKLPWSNFKI